MKAENDFHTAGMKSRRVSRVEALELAKLAETGYFGAPFAFAQELNPCAEKIGADYQEVTNFFAEIDFLPRLQCQPELIGGHCVVPNLNLLQQVEPSQLLEAVLDSNRRRAAQLRIEGRINLKSKSS